MSRLQRWSNGMGPGLLIAGIGCVFVLALVTPLFRFHISNLWAAPTAEVKNLNLEAFDALSPNAQHRVALRLRKDRFEQLQAARQEFASLYWKGTNDLVAWARTRLDDQ